MAPRSLRKYLLFAVAFLSIALLQPNARASNVQFVGTASYVVSGSLVTLTVNEIANFETYGSSGTLRLELWAFPAPFTGGGQTGYKLTEYALHSLSAGYFVKDISTGPIPYAPPPDGTWYYVLILTEYIATVGDDGYAFDDWINFPAVTIGSTSPPPPAITPQVGLWWNPNESGSGYALDYKHGVLVVTIYSYAPNGAAQWYLAAGPLNGGTFTATLDKYVNGQCIACLYNGRPTSPGNDGTITITFSSPTSATMYLPNGRVTQIQPEAF